MVGVLKIVGGLTSRRNGRVYLARRADICYRVRPTPVLLCLSEKGTASDAKARESGRSKADLRQVPVQGHALCPTRERCCHRGPRHASSETKTVKPEPNRDGHSSDHFLNEISPSMTIFSLQLAVTWATHNKIGLERSNERSGKSADFPHACASACSFILDCIPKLFGVPEAPTQRATIKPGLCIVHESVIAEVYRLTRGPRRRPLGLANIIIIPWIPCCPLDHKAGQPLLYRRIVRLRIWIPQSNPFHGALEIFQGFLPWSKLVELSGR